MCIMCFTKNSIIPIYSYKKSGSHNCDISKIKELIFDIMRLVWQDMPIRATCI